METTQYDEILLDGTGRTVGDPDWGAVSARGLELAGCDRTTAGLCNPKLAHWLHADSVEAVSRAKVSIHI